jgi:hypothetical protein
MGRIASLEGRRLLNPAFTGIVLLRAAQGYSKESEADFPFIYSYLVLPLVLHPETRERLPQSIVTKLLAWTERNGDLVAQLPRRVTELANATRQGLFAVSTTGLATLGASGQIKPVLSQKTQSAFERLLGSAEVIDCLKKANFVGRWLATAGTAPTVLTALGVRL